MIALKCPRCDQSTTVDEDGWANWHGITTSTPCGYRGPVSGGRARAQTVRELTAAAEFRARTHWIRFVDDDLRRELRVTALERHRSSTRPPTHAIESRTTRGGVAGSWAWWSATIEVLDAIGTLVPAGAP